MTQRLCRDGTSGGCLWQQTKDLSGAAKCIKNLLYIRRPPAFAGFYCRFYCLRHAYYRPPLPSETPLRQVKARASTPRLGSRRDDHRFLILPLDPKTISTRPASVIFLTNLYKSAEFRNTDRMRNVDRCPHNPPLAGNHSPALAGGSRLRAEQHARVAPHRRHYPERRPFRTSRRTR